MPWGRAADARICWVTFVGILQPEKLLRPQSEQQVAQEAVCGSGGRISVISAHCYFVGSQWWIIVYPCITTSTILPQPGQRTRTRQP